MSENKAPPKSLTDIVQCPVCHYVPPESKYYVCPTGHSICEHCFSTAEGQCPGCEAQYADPPPRNLMAEEIIEHNEDVEVSCENFLHGCKYAGAALIRRIHEDRQCKYVKASCPHVFCRSTDRLRNMHRHIRRCHQLQEYELTDELSLEMETFFRPNNFSEDVTWTFAYVQRGYDRFYVCRSIDSSRRAFLFYVVTSANPEVAQEYKLRFEFGSHEGSHYSCTAPVFSIAKSKTRVWSSAECLALSESLVSRFWTSNGIDEDRRAEGYTHKMECKIAIVEEPESVK